MAVKYELCVPNGTYQKDGQQKTNWLKIGRIMSKQSGGFAMKIDCTPTHEIDRDGNTVAWSGWVQMFEPQAREQAPSQPAPSADFDDDIVFLRYRIMIEFLEDIEVLLIIIVFLVCAFGFLAVGAFISEKIIEPILKLYFD